MNILIFSWRDPKHPFNGGAERVTHEHAKAWIKAGHSVTLFTSMYTNAKHEEVLDGVHIIRRGNELVTVQIAAFFWYLFAKHQSFDLVFDHFHGIPFFTPLFIRPKKIAFIHEVAIEVWKLNEIRGPLKHLPSFFGPIIEPMIFKLYRNIPFITVSESTKKDIMKMGIPEKNITIIENGLVTHKVETQKNKIKTAMYLGAIAKDKGIDDAINVFSKVYKKDSAWQFWIVGRGAEIEVHRLKEKSKRSGIAEKTIFWGYISEEKKFELLAKAHVLVNPSVHEGWGLVNLEANSVGTPVIAYDVHGSRDSIVHDKTGILVPRGDTKEMAKKVMELIDDKKRYGVMQKEVVAWSNRFTWEKATQESLAYIQKM